MSLHPTHTSTLKVQHGWSIQSHMIWKVKTADRPVRTWLGVRHPSNRSNQLACGTEKSKIARKSPDVKKAQMDRPSVISQRLYGRALEQSGVQCLTMVKSWPVALETTTHAPTTRSRTRHVATRMPIKASVVAQCQRLLPTWTALFLIMSNLE